MNKVIGICDYCEKEIKEGDDYSGDDGSLVTRSHLICADCRKEFK